MPKNEKSANSAETRKVTNSKTKERAEFSIKLTPEEAVLSAYAYLTMNDHDSLSHEKKYSSLVTKGDDFVQCGHWKCKK